MTKKEKLSAYNKNYYKEYYSKNKLEIVEYSRKYAAEHKKESRDYKIFKKYGLKDSDVNLIKHQQKSKCKICLTSFKTMLDRHMHIDHEHETNIVRGLLCHSCNTALGGFKDNIQLLKTAIRYIVNKGNI